MFVKVNDGWDGWGLQGRTLTAEPECVKQIGDRLQGTGDREMRSRKPNWFAPGISCGRRRIAGQIRSGENNREINSEFCKFRLAWMRPSVQRPGRDAPAAWWRAPLQRPAPGR